MDVINNFTGDFSFLNGFYETPVVYNFRTYRCSECAYYAQKTLDGEKRESFEKLKGESAYKLNKQLKVRVDWELLKETEMYNITWCKFTQNEDLKKLLLDTGEKFLIDVNTYGDEFWGISEGKGENLRGFILMNIRSRLRTVEKYGVENMEDLIESDYYDYLDGRQIDFEFSMVRYKEDIVQKFIEVYGYNELLLMLLPSMIDDNDSLNGEWDDEIDFINDLTVGDY